MIFVNCIELGNLLLRNTPWVGNAKARLVSTQKEFVTPGGKSIAPDIYIEDELGRRHIYEIQRKSSGAHKDRMSYELSLLDSRSLPKGGKYESHPDTTVVYIIEKDIFGDGRKYHRFHGCEQDKGNKDAGFRQRMVVMNGAFTDKDGKPTELGMLMHDMHCSD